MGKDMKRIVREAEALGWRVERTRNNHLSFFSPDGKHVVHTGGTPQDWRAIRNLQAQIHRYGCGARVAFG